MREPKLKKGVLRHYKEGTMTFRPTYKFIVKTNEYDWNRFPSYTDRILFESVHPLPQQNPLMNVYYGSVDYELSDHKPITGLFEAKIKVVDQVKKQELIDKIKEQYEGKSEETDKRKQ